MSILRIENLEPNNQSAFPPGLGFAIMLTLSALIFSGTIYGATSLLMGFSV